MRGWACAVVNHRGLGGVALASAHVYSAGFTGDLRWAVTVRPLHITFGVVAGSKPGYCTLYGRIHICLCNPGGHRFETAVACESRPILRNWTAESETLCSYGPVLCVLAPLCFAHAEAEAACRSASPWHALAPLGLPMQELMSDALN
jgi:hypothetical protein